MSTLGRVTHVVYAAVYEKPGLIAGWRDQEQMDTNLAMLRNLMYQLRCYRQLRMVGAAPLPRCGQ